MWQAAKILLGLACLGYVAVCLLLYLFQSRLVYIPSRDMAGDPSDEGLAFEPVRLESQGKKLSAWHVPCEGARGAVVFCHGNAGNISHRLATLRILHTLGLEVVIFDYQGYGLSQGRPSELGTYADARAAWDWLMAHGGSPERTVIMGRSLGGAVAAGLAEQLEREGITPAGLILESTFTSVPDLGSQLYPWLPVRPLSRYSYDTLSRLPGMDCPVQLAHSPEDDVVPYSHGQALAKVLGPEDEFLELRGGHNQGYLDMGQDYLRGLDHFFTQVLGARAQDPQGSGADAETGP